MQDIGFLKNICRKYESDESVENPDCPDLNTLVPFWLHDLGRNHQTNKHQLTIRLSHDGFRYPKMQPDTVIDVISSHSGIRGFSTENIKSLVQIQNLVQAHFFRFLYRKARRIDIEFYSDDDGEECCLKITFEHGSPRGVNKKEYLHDLRGDFNPLLDLLKQQTDYRLREHPY